MKPDVVAVRALCEFVHKSGDLDLRFTPSPSAREGVAGHQTVVSRRPAHYQAELALTGQHRGLTVRGRADGYDPKLRRLEEIKTHRGDLDKLPDNHRALHWAQARIYGAMLCAQTGLDRLTLALVYFDVGSEQEQVITQEHTAEALDDFFHRTCAAYLGWAQQEAAHRRRRDQALSRLEFPWPAFRAGQRTLAEQVYKAISTGRCLLAQAPTGIGKTLGTLFPALKRMVAGPAHSGLDKLFFLTARTAGRQVALDSLSTLSSQDAEPLSLRVLELTARDKACEYPDRACNGDACPLAQGFYDRLPEARAAACEYRHLDRHQLRVIARAHQVCPYFLAQEMTRWSDVIVCDYHYYFDTHAPLYAVSQALNWRVGVLVDEAHNLIPRSRDMYSAHLDSPTFRAAARAAPGPVRRALRRLERHWKDAAQALSPQTADAVSLAHQPLDAPPETLLAPLNGFLHAWQAWVTEHPANPHPQVQEAFFQALHFQRLAELWDSDHSLADLTWDSASGQDLLGHRTLTNAGWHLRNVVPAPFLQDRFAAADSVVLFSATLSPTTYQLSLLGLADDTAVVDIPPPFVSQQLQIRTYCNISTRFRDRSQSVDAVARAMAEGYRARPGNYLAFFSSFSYLEQVRERFHAHSPDISVRAQQRQMSESDRDAFIAGFTEQSADIGFVVLGGVFGEGIDLVGARLIGAFVATLGLPQWNPVNEQVKVCLARRFGAGYDYAYLYPGLQKVTQAAGRIIRSEQDVGTLHLLDDRFTQPRIQALLPAWWRWS